MSTPDALLLPSVARLHALAEWLEQTDQTDLAEAVLRAAAALKADEDKGFGAPTLPVRARRGA